MLEAFLRPCSYAISEPLGPCESTTILIRQLNLVAVRKTRDAFCRF